MNDEHDPEPKRLIDDRWLSRERALLVLLSLATAAAVYLCFLLIVPFLPAVAWALVLAVVAHPLHQWMIRRVRSPNLAAALSVAVVTVVIVAPAWFVVQRIVREAAGAVGDLNEKTTSKHWQAMLDKYPSLERAWKRIEPYVAPDQGDAPVNFRDQLSQALQWTARQFSAFVLGSVMLLTQLALSLFLLFYLFRDWRTGLLTVRSLVPLSESETDKLFSRVADTINASIYGTLVIAVVKGILAGICYVLLGLPNPLLWSVMTALTSVIPVVGPTVIWIPAALYFGVEQEEWWKAGVLLLWCGGAVSMIDNLLYPILVGAKLRLHPMPVFFALIGGLAFFGASGLVLGPLVLAVTDALIDVWRRRWLASSHVMKVRAG